MLIRIAFKFDRDRVRITLAEPPEVLTEPNAIAIDTDRKQVIAVGNSAVRGLSGDVEYRRAYDPDAFDPEMTAAFVHYYKLVMYQRVRPSLLRAIIPGVIDRFEIDLTLPDLSSLGPHAQDHLSSALAPVFRRATVLVNGHRLTRRQSR